MSPRALVGTAISVTLALMSKKVSLIGVASMSEANEMSLRLFLVVA